MKRSILFALLDRAHYLIALIIAAALAILEPSGLHSGLFPLLAAYIIASEVYIYFKSKDTRNLSADILSTLSPFSQERIAKFPLPIVICEDNGDILCFDAKFKDTVSEEAVNALKNVKAINASILSEPSVEVFFDARHFRVFNDTFLSKNEKKHILYFIEITEFVKLKRQFGLSKPIVAHIVVDNYDELFQKARESEKSSAMAQIDLALANWGQSVGGLMQKTGVNRYLFLFRNRDLSVFTENRFAILDEIRALNVSLISYPTLSIGIGRGNETFLENDEDAAKALETALSRGGDQVVIKNGASFDFFGGTSKGMEKRTKVKARMMAANLGELLKKVDTVLVMGHQMSDFDSLGACVGMARIALANQKKVGIVYDKKSSLAGPLYDSLMRSPEIAATFVSPEDAVIMDGENTMVVVVDTHRAAMTTMPDLLRFTKHIVLIDHHRRAADYIENPELVFHEPSASSVCEMMTELLQYMDINTLSVEEAEALLAGICLDTKNFTLRTGNFTFEACAFLRDSGADPVRVKRLFQTDMETYMRRALMVRKAEICNGIIAIASWDEPVDASEFKIIASLAADDMLNIEGVCASCTYFLDRGTGVVNLSARSFGVVNVQLIMEKLGGGGHQTMAGAQLRDVTPEEARERLIKAIDEYLQENKI